MQTNGAVVCWGHGYYGRATPPGGTFQRVSTGYYHTCGVTTDGIVACWGREARGIVRTDDGGIAVAALGQPAPALGKPTNVAATAAGYQVTVTWIDAPGAVRHLAILAKSDFSGAPLSGTATGGSHTFSGVPAGSYVAAVIAYDARGKYRFGISPPVTVAATPVSQDRAILETL